ncbi:hypothetical protein B0H10DRAFT_1960754 [Mycena sp. CBHHK59/15]|nr:hypothetical protein B0H10DRAFT_1960754 [Mycena sp. CBHHK59/15]
MIGEYAIPESELAPLVLPPAEEQHISLLTIEDISATLDTYVSPFKKKKKKRQAPEGHSGSHQSSKKNWVTEQSAPVESDPHISGEAGSGSLHFDSNPSQDVDEGGDWNQHKYVQQSEDSHQALPNNNSHYMSFVDSVGIGMIGFFQISKALFVCEGWDRRRCVSTGLWYHIQLIEGFETIIPCVHEQFLVDHGTEAFLTNDIYENDSTCKAALFSREVSGDNTISIFSIATVSQPEALRARAIVTNKGDGLGIGSWSCSRESSPTACWHISVARNYLQKLLTGDLNARDPRDWNEIGLPEGQVRMAQTDKSVSYLVLPRLGSAQLAIGAKPKIS